MSGINLICLSVNTGDKDGVSRFIFRNHLSYIQNKMTNDSQNFLRKCEKKTKKT